MNPVTLFYDEERILINGICKDEKLSTLTKNDGLASLRFSRNIADENETMLLDLLDDTITKLDNLSDNEWDELKMLTPLPVSISADDDEDEIRDEADE